MPRHAIFIGFQGITFRKNLDISSQEPNWRIENGTEPTKSKTKSKICTLSQISVKDYYREILSDQKLLPP